MAPEQQRSKKGSQTGDTPQLKFPDWLAQQLRSAGRTQREIAEEAGVNQNDLSRWKNGQAVPEMDNLLRLAHYFSEDPERLFVMAGKPELIEAYRLFLPQYQKKELSEGDLYKNRQHAELHRRVQKLLDRGFAEQIEQEIKQLETHDFMHFRLREAVEFSEAEAGFLLKEEDNLVSCEYWHKLDFDEVDLDLPERRKPGWVVFKGSSPEIPIKIYLCLKNPKIEPHVRKLIDTYMYHWLDYLAPLRELPTKEEMKAGVKSVAKMKSWTKVGQST